MNSQKNSWDVGSQHIFRVDKVHGGQVVEEVEKPELMNEPDCKHASFSIDPTETDFIAYVCDNPKCAIVKLYSLKEK